MHVKGDATASEFTLVQDINVVGCVGASSVNRIVCLSAYDETKVINELGLIVSA